MNLPTSLRAAAFVTVTWLVVFLVHQNEASIVEAPESKEDHLRLILGTFPGDEIDRDKHGIPLREQWADILEGDYERVAWRIIEAFEQSNLNYKTHSGYFLTVSFLSRHDVATTYTLRRVRAEIDELAGEVSKLLSNEAAAELRRAHEPGTPLPNELMQNRTIHRRSEMRLGMLITIGETEDLERFRPFMDVENESLSSDAAWYLENLEARLEDRYPPLPPGHTAKMVMSPDRYEELKRQYESGEMDEKMRDWWERYE